MVLEARLAPESTRVASNEIVDVVVVGSGSAAAAAALKAALGGLSVLMLEKTELLGGTSAMSGAGVWIPGNHHARDAGLADSSEEALKYLRSASPEGWQATEEPLWASFVEAAPRMLAFLEAQTPLRFALTSEPDPMTECKGGKKRGRMVSPRPLSRRLLGPLSKRLRRDPIRAGPTGASRLPPCRHEGDQAITSFRRPLASARPCRHR